MSTKPTPVATVRLNADINKVYISGPHGAAAVRGDDPVEIGLHLLECLNGTKVSPPVSYRKPEVVDMLDPNLRIE